MNEAFVQEVMDLHKQGMDQKEIAKKYGFSSVSKLRLELGKARTERKEYLTKRIHELYSEGKKPVEIAKKVGISEARVRYYLAK